MKRKSLKFYPVLALVLVLLLALTGTVGAQGPADNGAPGEDTPAPQDISITVNGGWQFWSWGGSGPVYNNGGALTFTSATPVLLKVTDDFCKGDQFRVYDSGVLVGDTSAVAVGACSGVGPDAAFADPTYSSGAFLLGPGTHSITIQVIVNPFNSGGAYIRVDTATGAFVTDIPDPDAYTCYQPGYIDFEAYADGFNLSAGAIGGVQFTTTGGYTWLVGDFATGYYNGKYPSGGYTSQGTHWAWLGTNQGAGRIDFVLGPATYFSLLTSVNLSSVYLEAYDASNTLLDTAGPATINYNTGHMWELAISRSSADIAYVVVHDAGNFFEVDAICTDAPGVPNPTNQLPSADPNGPYFGDEGSAIPLDGTGSSDPDGDLLTYAWSVDSALCSFDDATSATPNLTCTDNGAFTATLVVDDGQATDSDTASVAVSNVAPSVSIDGVSPTLLAVGESVTANGSFTDPGANDTHTEEWDWGDGSLDSDNSHEYSAAGIYTIQLTVTDDDGGVGTAAYQFVVVYDPSAGFVTGGGWIWSPQGAYVPDPELEGKANFGFVSKYKKGTTVPDGNTEFQFHAAGLNFHSDTYEWLVVTGSNYARFKGVGTINGEGEYKFMLWAGDGTGTDGADTFRIRIWTEDEFGVETVVYDNGMDQDIGGGSIVVHTKK